MKVFLGTYIHTAMDSCILARVCLWNHVLVMRTVFWGSGGGV